MRATSPHCSFALSVSFYCDSLLTAFIVSRFYLFVCKDSHSFGIFQHFSKKIWIECLSVTGNDFLFVSYLEFS